MNPSILKAIPLAISLATSAAWAVAPVAQGSFNDDLNSYDTARWLKAGTWANGSPFNNAWMTDHVSMTGGVMSIKLDNVVASVVAPTVTTPYTSGTYQSTGFYGYGCYETRMKPVKQSGVVSSFFTFAGPSDNGGNGIHNEIDIEFLGNNTFGFQANFWTNDAAYTSNNAKFIPLSFDTSLDYHQYAFKWTSTGIQWFVDGTLVYPIPGLHAALVNTPKVTDSVQKIMMNVWPVDSTAAGWAGTFVYPGAPVTGMYDWTKYVSGETCTVSKPTDVHVQAITQAVITQKTQVTSKITVLDGKGLPVPSASVTGVWSGVITSGGTVGLTDSTGSVTLTSAKSSTAGKVTFCVSSIAAAGLSYAAGANLATCSSITK
ncbi:MAG: family 16 glycosylhydrolase [Leptothrix sp. (in: b-proteobacteria)]